MSDTPRTDNYIENFPGSWREPRLLDFARQLERELADKDRQLAELKADRVAISQQLSDALDALFASNQKLAEARAEIGRLKGQLSDIEEREAACCPEDVSFDVLIAALRKQVLRLERENAELKTEIEKYKIGKVSPADYYSMAEAEEKLCKELADARAEVEHWKVECSDLVRKAHEMRAEIDYFQTLIDLRCS